MRPPWGQAFVSANTQNLDINNDNPNHRPEKLPPTGNDLEET